MPPRLTPGENLQLQQNLQVLQDLEGSAREERAQREPGDEQTQPQPDVEDSEMAICTETPDAEVIRRTHILAKRPDPAVPTDGCSRGCESGLNTRVR